MRFIAALQVLATHWTYRPLQFFALLVGLSLATGLWTGVQAINTEARSSYKTAQATLIAGAGSFDSLRRRDGKSIALSTYVGLQKSGWNTSPILEGDFEVGDQTIQLVGVDLISLPRTGDHWSGEMMNTRPVDFLTAPFVLLASPELVQLLEKIPGLPPVETRAEVPVNTVITDIGNAADLLGQFDSVSSLVLWPSQLSSRVELAKIAPQLVVVKNRPAEDIGRLTDSFHLNLTAFGMLAFAVGLFIVQGTINLAFEQRRSLCRILRVMGLSVWDLAFVLVIELLAIAILAGALGVILGYFIAAALLPDVAATLRGLYGAQLSGELEFRIGWWVAGLAIAVVGTFLAAFWSLFKLVQMPILASVHPRAWALMSTRLSVYRLLASMCLILASCAIWFWGSGLVAAFAIVAGFLLGAAVILPDIFSVVIGFFGRFSNQPVSQWFWADTRQQLPALSLALMALLLALAANIGVSTMVGSFRLTFAGWLDQRLAAELYVRAENLEQADQLRIWLQSRSDAVLPVWSTDAILEGEPGQIFGFADHATYRDNWPMLDISPDAWSEVEAGRAVFINEQLARRKNLDLGQMVRLGTDRERPVVGVYSDYGNPRPQVLLNVNLLTRWHPDVEKLRFAIRVGPDKAASLARDITEEFGLVGRNLVDQALIKKRSFEVFEKTFAVTQVLNILTLSVAGFAIFTSLLTQSAMRLPQLAPIWALGLTRRNLAGLEFLRAMLLAALTMVFALPLGLGLAWLLLAVVNVEAFGWRLPLFVFTRDWIILATYGFVATALAAAIPVRRFNAISPADLVKVFAHER